MTYAPKLDRIEPVTQAKLDELRNALTEEKKKYEQLYNKYCDEHNYASKINLSELSKTDAAALGIADMTGPQMRMHILKLEGELCEMKQAMKEMLEMSRAVYCIGCGAELDRGEQHSCACPWDRIRELLNG